MWFWGISVCFPVLGFCVLFCFLFFWAKKKNTKKNLLLVFVLLLVRTLNIEVFLKIKEEEKLKELTTGAYAITSFLSCTRK